MWWMKLVDEALARDSWPLKGPLLTLLSGLTRKSMRTRLAILNQFTNEALPLFRHEASHSKPVAGRDSFYLSGT